MQNNVLKLSFKDGITQKEYKNAIDENILNYIEKVENGYTANLKISNPTNEEIRQIKNLTEIDTSDYSIYLRPSTIKHIKIRHGENGKHDNSMRDIEDIARLPYILETYDDMKLANNNSAMEMNSDNTNAKVTIINKRINGTYFVAEAIPNSKAKNIVI